MKLPDGRITIYLTREELDHANASLSALPRCREALASCKTEPPSSSPPCRWALWLSVGAGLVIASFLAGGLLLHF